MLASIACDVPRAIVQTPLDWRARSGRLEKCYTAEISVGDEMIDEDSVKSKSAQRAEVWKKTGV
jgi:hypothetical protein